MKTVFYKITTMYLNYNSTISIDKDDFLSISRWEFDGKVNNNVKNPNQDNIYQNMWQK